MGRAASWGSGRGALEHIRPLADSERTAGRLIAATALGVAAEDPVLVAEVRYRLRQWSLATSPRLRTTVAYACGAEFGRSRPDTALRLLRTLLCARDRHGGKQKADNRVLTAVRAAVLSLFQAGYEPKVFGWLLDLLDTEEEDDAEALTLFGQLLGSPRWFLSRLSVKTPETGVIVDAIRDALNAESSFDATCAELLHWSAWGRWDDTVFRAMENLCAALARSMRSGEFRLFVEMDQAGAEDWAGFRTARAALNAWREGRQREAA